MTVIFQILWNKLVFFKQVLSFFWNGDYIIHGDLLLSISISNHISPAEPYSDTSFLSPKQNLERIQELTIFCEIFSEIYKHVEVLRWVST